MLSLADQRHYNLIGVVVNMAPRTPPEDRTMRRMSSLCLFLLAFAVPAHSAAVTPPGVNLRWDNCYADGGAQNKDFACDTNAGSERLVGSFELASSMSGVTGLEIYLHLGSSSASLPAWWQFKNAATCRQTALAAQFSPPTGSAGCVDWGGASEAGGIGSYLLNTQGPNHALIAMAVAVPAPVELAAGQEHYAFTLTINHTKTVGLGACAGCAEPVVIFLSAIRIVPGTNPGVLLTDGANFMGSRWVSWQQAFPTNIQQGCQATGGGLFCFNPTTFFDVVLSPPTPNRSSTWGQLKSLYR